MILILTNSADTTADYLCRCLSREAIEHVRVDTDNLIKRTRLEWSTSKAQIKLRGKTVDAHEVKDVWLRRPTAPRLPGSDSPAKCHAAYEWAEAIEGFLAHIPRKRWINHPSANAGASHKLEQLSRAKQFGFCVPRTIVTQSPKTAKRFWKEFEGEVVVKPLAAGYIEEVTKREDSLIYTNKIGVDEIRQAELIRKCPTLFQEKIQKFSDVRAVYLDGEVIAVELVAQDVDGCQRLDIRRNNMSDVRYRRCNIPAKMRRQIVALLKSYDLRFGAMDFAIDTQGNWVFFEVNPNGQWAWLDLEAGTDIAAVFTITFRR